MLNRDRLIADLTTEEGDHDKLFRLRRELRALALPALAERYKRETGKDPYDLPAE